MPLYKQHAKFNILLLLPILTSGIIFLLRPSNYLTLTFISSFIYSTLFMNPDLDLANKIRLFSIRGLLTLPFRLYSYFFSHRGLSHHPLLGSLTRIAWLIGLATLIFFIVYKSLPTTETFHTFYKLYEPYILYGLAGVCFADWGHLFLDRKER